MREETLEIGLGRGWRAGSTWRKSELQFRRLLEKLPAGAYTCDPDGLITYFNQHAVKLWGRAPKLNDPVDRYCGSFKLYSTDGPPISHDQCWMALALRTDREYNGREIVVERPDGERLTALAHANPIHDESGKLLGAVNVLVDITDRKRAEEKVRFQAHLLEQVQTAVIATDMQGEVIHWNEYAEKLYGWSREEAVGRNISELTIGPKEIRVAEEIMIQLRAGKSWEGEFVTRRKDGSSFPAYVTDSLVHDDQGNAIGIVGVSTDITERKRLEESLYEIREAERRRIARDLHDVVLQDLAGALQGMQAARIEARRAGAEIGLEQEIDALRRASKGLRNAIYNLRLEGRQTFVRAVESLVELNSQMTPEREITLTLQDGFPQELPECVSVEMLRVLQEALSNARRHSGASRVEVALSMEGDLLRAEIRDDGRGFDPHSARIGLGISGMRERASALGGELEIEGHPGRGVGIRVEIPIPESADV
ncbi:MAG TPA: PAS domain S-box protein [Rubrobacteraceae bacterium]|nr:PAS domain S-box protein [Rubrobacteraceae bacterium]